MYFTIIVIIAIVMERDVLVLLRTVAGKGLGFRGLRLKV